MFSELLKHQLTRFKNFAVFKTKINKKEVFFKVNKIKYNIEANKTIKYKGNQILLPSKVNTVKQFSILLTVVIAKNNNTRAMSTEFSEEK